jgi:hypothetical protein
MSPTRLSPSQEPHRWGQLPDSCSAWQPEPRKWYNYGGGDENNSYPADPVRGISRADEDQKR